MDDARKVKPLHQPQDGATGDTEAFSSKLILDFPQSIDPQVVAPDALDLGTQRIVTLRPVRASSRIALLSLAGVVTGRGNLQNPAVRFDPVHITIFINEDDDLRNGRSSFA